MVAEGEVPGGTGPGGDATGGDGDEAVWLDLVARFHAPAAADEAVPWPDREDLAGPVHVTPALPPSAPPSGPDALPSVPEALPKEPPTNPSGLPGLPVFPSIPTSTGPTSTGPANTGP